MLASGDALTSRDCPAGATFRQRRLAKSVAAGHCPKCQAAAARQWLEDREAELLPVPYYHVVFTLPASIGAIAFQNKAAVYDLLFRTAADTLITIAADPKHLGARIGLTAVLHRMLLTFESVPEPQGPHGGIEVPKLGAF
jgi:Transposase zinc-binding domain